MSDTAEPVDPIQTVSVAIRRSGWQKILAIAKEEGRGERRMAGILLEEHPRLLEHQARAAVA